MSFPVISMNGDDIIDISLQSDSENDSDRPKQSGGLEQTMSVLSHTMKKLNHDYDHSNSNSNTHMKELKTKKQNGSGKGNGGGTLTDGIFSFFYGLQSEKSTYKPPRSGFLKTLYSAYYGD